MALRQNASTGELVEDGRPKEPAVPKEPVQEQLRIKVWSPFQVYFDGEAQSVSGVNSTGPFDILPEHKNFISLLNACDLVVQSKDGEVKVRISGGVMQVHKNKVVVFLEV